MKRLILGAMVALMAISTAEITASNFVKAPRKADIKLNERKLPVDRKKAPAGVDDIITSPKGELIYYDKECAGTFAFGGSMSLYKDVLPSLIIWGSDNKVYFRNLITVFPEDYYVEGTLEGDVITVETDQLISYYPEENIGYTFCALKISENEAMQRYEFTYAPEIKSIQYKLGADGSLSMILPGKPYDGGDELPEYIMGICYSDSYEYTGCGDFMQEFTKLELQMVQMPPEAKVEQYAYIDEFSYASLVDVAFYGDDLYIRGLSSMLPDATLRARIEGDKAYIAQNQFLGVYYDLFYIFSKILLPNPDYNEDSDEFDVEPFILAPENEEFMLHVSPDRKRIYADTPDVYLSYHCDENDFMNTLAFFGMFEMLYQDTYGGTPSVPVNLEYHSREEWSYPQGFNDFMFTLSNFSTAGKVLDVEKLYYQIYLNGELMVFKEQELIDLLDQETLAYVGVPVAVNLLPYMFANYDDIYKFADNEFDIGIYTDDVVTIGVQSAYYFEDKITYSDIAILDVATGEITIESGVTPVLADEVVKTEYFTLDGRRIVNPAKGIYIKVDTLSNGARKSNKIIK